MTKIQYKEIKRQKAIAKYEEERLNSKNEFGITDKVPQEALNNIIARKHL